MNPRSKKIQKTLRDKVSSEELEEEENHARAKFDKEQEEYIAEKIRPLIEDELINNKEECIKKMFEFCDEYIQIHKKGRRPKIISQTTCYGFLKKNNIKPPTKQKKKNEKKKKKNDVPTLSNRPSRAQQREIDELLKEKNFHIGELERINARLIELGHKEPQKLNFLNEELPFDDEHFDSLYPNVTNLTDEDINLDWIEKLKRGNSKEKDSKSSSKVFKGLSDPNSIISNKFSTNSILKKSDDVVSIPTNSKSSEKKIKSGLSNPASREVLGLSNPGSLTNGNSRYFFRFRNSGSHFF